MEGDLNTQKEKIKDFALKLEEALNKVDEVIKTDFCPLCTADVVIARAFLEKAMITVMMYGIDQLPL